jgi:hypothetical protein
MMGTSEREPEATGKPSTNVVEAVAAAERVAPPNVPTPLYDSIDPDALDALVASADDVSITFSYLGYVVTVDGDGTVSLEG